MTTLFDAIQAKAAETNPDHIYKAPPSKPSNNDNKVVELTPTEVQELWDQLPGGARRIGPIEQAFNRIVYRLRMIGVIAVWFMAIWVILNVSPFLCFLMLLLSPVIWLLIPDFLMGTLGKPQDWRP